MLHYWRINKKAHYSLLLTTGVLFIFSLTFKNASGQSFSEQLVYVFLPLLSVLLLLYLVHFLISFWKFQNQSKTFTQPIFNNLTQKGFQHQETKPTLFFLAGLTIKGSSNGFPVRIEYDKGMVEIVVGVEKNALNVRSAELKGMLKAGNLTVGSVGIVKKIRQEDLLNCTGGNQLVVVIEETTGYIKQLNINPYILRTT
jgi:hypothetical protein